MKRLFMIIIAVIVCLMPFGILAGAASPSGNITVIMINKADKSPLTDKAVYFVPVADCAFSGHSAAFSLNVTFADTGVDLAETDAASKLYDATKEKGLMGTPVKTDAEGKASFDCDLGAYLVYSQNNYFNPFIVFIPYETEDELIFSVTAEPKIDVNPEDETNPDLPEDTTPIPFVPVPPVIVPVPVVPVIPPVPVIPGGDTPSTPDTPANPGTTPPASDNTPDTTPGSPTEPPEKLPQTGMVQYPIPILGFLGIMMFATGFVIYGEGKKKEN